MLPLVTHPSYSYEFDTNHRFPMAKFSLLHQYLKEQGIATKTNTFRPGRAKLDLLTLAHDKNYLHRFINNQQSRKEQRDMGLPWSQGLVNRTLISPAGTLYAAHLAQKHGLACHLAGGTHHAQFDHASGFCILNDLAISALAMIKTNRAKRILIFDCDVHQGDGTANLLKDHGNIFTCSIHARQNFPFVKAISDWDIELETTISDEQYCQLVINSFNQCLRDFKPDLVLYDAGVDVYKNDPLGRLDISLEAIAKRDRLVLEKCLTSRIPVATVIGGGYDKDHVALAKRHAIVTEQAFSLLNTR